LLSLTVLATLLILAGIYVSDNLPREEYGGLTKEQVNAAIDIALHDPSFYYDPSRDKYWTGNVVQTTFGEYGLINASGNYVDVPVQLREQAPMRQDFVFTVDLDNKKVIVKKIVFSESLMGRSFEANIPPGAYFYRKYWTSRFLFMYDGFDKPVLADNGVDLISSGPLEPMFLNNSNFEKFRNGTTFDVMQYVDYPVNSTYVQAGPMRDTWSAYIRAKNESFYFVLRNLDTKNVTTVSIHERPLPPPPESL
jgi:hypothetical protein